MGSPLRRNKKDEVIKTNSIKHNTPSVANIKKRIKIKPPKSPEAGHSSYVDIMDQFIDKPKVKNYEEQIELLRIEVEHLKNTLFKFIDWHNEIHNPSKEVKERVNFYNSSNSIVSKINRIIERASDNWNHCNEAFLKKYLYKLASKGIDLDKLEILAISVTGIMKFQDLVIEHYGKDIRDLEVVFQSWQHFNSR